MISLPKPFPPHQKTHWRFLKMDLESTTPHHFTAISLILATIISCPHSFGSLRIGLSASTLAPLRVVLNRAASEPLKYHVRLSSFTPQNPVMASHFTQTKNQSLHGLRFLYNLSLSSSTLPHVPHLCSSHTDCLVPYVKLLSEYGSFTMLCKFLPYCKVNQRHVYIHPFFLRTSFPFGHHRAMSGVSCAIQ